MSAWPKLTPEFSPTGSLQRISPSIAGIESCRARPLIMKMIPIHCRLMWPNKHRLRLLGCIVTRDGIWAPNQAIHDASIKLLAKDCQDHPRNKYIALTGSEIDA